MKKLLLTLCLIAGFAGSLLAQYDAKALKAQEVLDKVSSKYEELDGFSADFVYTLYNKATGTNAEARGSITAKGKKFKLNLNGQNIVSDGETVWTFQPETNEVYIDHFENLVGENVNPSNIHNLYKKGYKHEYKREKMINGAPHHVVELVPENPGESELAKIELVIHQQNLTISSFTIHEKSKNEYSFDIRNFNSNISPAEESFSFNKSKHPNVVEVDMRDF